MPSKNRNYRKEYDEYQGTPEQKKRRAQRNKARRMMEKDGKVRKGDGKEVDHIKMMEEGGKTTKGNLRVVSRSTNRRKQPKTKG